MASIDLSSLRSLNPKEIYNWPLPIKILVGFGVFLLILALGTYFHLMDKYDTLKSAEQKEVVLKNDFVEKKKKSINLPLYKKQLEEVTITSDNLLKQLPNKSEMDKLLLDINQSATSKGLQIDLFKPEKEKLNDFYAELPISIKVSGDYKSMGEFAEEVSKLPRVVLLKDLNLTPKALPSNVSKDDVTNNNLLALETTAKTFRYLDEEELEKQRQVALAAKKAKNEKKK